MKGQRILSSSHKRKQAFHLDKTVIKRMKIDFFSSSRRIDASHDSVSFRTTSTGIASIAFQLETLALE